MRTNQESPQTRPSADCGNKMKSSRINLLTFACAVAALFSLQALAADGELLYNGIRLPEEWPPRELDSASREVPVMPYLQTPPDRIPIDVGRQLFVDDFLIASTDLKRVFHQPVKYENNPVLRPETAWEKGTTGQATAAPFSDGCFYDPADHLFKLWYMAGWYDGTALATSKDGIHWKRPELDVVPGSNRVLAVDEASHRDGMSLWLDENPASPAERFKMFLYQRQGEAGTKLPEGGGSLLTSPDGIHWTRRGNTGQTRDNTTFFYNPFRRVWVFSHRSRTADAGKLRARSYWENKDFLAALDDWKGYKPVFWIGADKLDLPDPQILEEPQLYKVDAVAYESLMLGLCQVHYGPVNWKCAKKGVPKVTELQVAFSRDGFHFDRSVRKPFIGAARDKASWERGYVSSTGGCCLVVGDKLYFYYTAFQGDESNRRPEEIWSGMYANASTGLAILRRDGFASMDAAAGGGQLTTRPVVFTGKQLFVNVDCPQGTLTADVLDEGGKVIKGFSAEDSETVSSDSTLQNLTWRGGDLSGLAGKPVRFRFHLSNGRLYAFWVAPDPSGASRGYVAAGGPGFGGSIDNAGAAAYSAAAKDHGR